MGKEWEESRNINGIWVIEICVGNYLIITNTKFRPINTKIYKGNEKEKVKINYKLLQWLKMELIYPSIENKSIYYTLK